MAQITQIKINGVTYNVTDKDAQTKIAAILESVYSKEEIDAAIANVNEELKDYAKTADVAAAYQPKGDYLTEHLDISGKADKSEIPTKVSELVNDVKFQTETEVNTAIQKVVGAAPEALDTLEEIAAKLNEDSDAINAINGVLTGKANSSDVYTKAEVNEAIGSAVEEIDLTPYETVEGAANKYQSKGDYLTEHQSLEDYVKKDAFVINGETLEITFN